MKILWLSHLVPYPPKAGVLLRAHYLVKELAKYHDVDLLAFNQRALIEPYFDSYEQGTNIARQEMNKICGRVEFVDVPVDRSKFSKVACALSSLVSPMPYNINWLKDAHFAELVKKWCEEKKYDVIHCDTISLVPFIAEQHGVKLSLDHHNVESHMLFRRSELEKNLLKKLYFYQEAVKVERYEKKVCPSFDTNLTCSELDTQRFQDLCPTASFTEIPNGVDTEVFTPGEGTEDSCTLIFIGTLDWYPNTRAARYLANEIWPLVREALPEARVNIIGKGAPEDLLQLSQNDERFSVLGYVDELKPYLDHATIYVCPIDDGGGTKLKLLDAFSAGKAVIAHEVACEGLRVEDGKHALIANDPQTYLQKIQQLVADPELRKQLQENARKHAVEQFSFTSIGQHLSAHFESL